MKKTIFRLFALPAIALATAGFLFSSFSLSAQTDITVQDDAKVGVIVTGTGNTINTTQIFGKSPEYAELKKRLDGLQATIAKKADECEQMAKDSLPAKYRDNCRAELIALNAERDSVQKIDSIFREDVIRLAETFSRIELNSERLRLAKKFFEEGKISEADNVLKEKDMAATGDAALAAKARSDSVLLQTANEFALKAQLKALKMDYDSAQILFAQSRKYFETVDNLWNFASLLGEQNQSHRALDYYEKALRLARFESEEAALAMGLGNFYSKVQKMAEAEKMYLRSLDIYERLAKANSEQFDSDLALIVMNLGVFYTINQKMGEAEKMLLHSLEIYGRLAKANSEQFEPDLAMTLMNLGVFYYTNYYTNQKMGEAEKMLLHSLDIYERLAKANPAQFGPDLAKTAMNLGSFYYRSPKIGEAENMYLRSLDIYEQLAKANPAQFEPDLANTCKNLGSFYGTIQKMGKAENLLLRSLDIYERLAKANPAQFEPDLASTLMNLGSLYFTNQKVRESGKVYLRSLDIYERLAASNPAQFEPDLAKITMNLGNFYATVQKMGDTEKMYLRSLDIYERLAASNPAQFEPDLAMTLSNFGYFRQENDKLEEARKMYSRVLVLRQKAVANGRTHFLSDLILVYNNMASLRDSFETRGDITSAVSIQIERAECVYALKEVNIDYKLEAASAFDELYQTCFYAKMYQEAAEAAERVLELASSRNWVRTTLGHSHLLRGDWDKAKAVYEEYLKNEPDPAEGKKTLLKDWDDLEKAGVTHPDMEKARAWVRG